mgnify:CR=1 FL=1
MAVLGQWQYFPKTHIAALSLIVLIVIFAAGEHSNSKQKREVQTLIVNSEANKNDYKQEEAESWQQTELKAGDNLSRIFTRHSLSAADALAIAICHAHTSQSLIQMAGIKGNRGSRFR